MTAPKPPKPTHAERRAAAALQRDKELRELEAQRPALWQTLWAKALHIQLLVAQAHAVFTDHVWWFYEFHVDALRETVQFPTLGKPRGQADFPLAEFERANDELDRAVGWFKDHHAEQERLRLEELARQELATQGRAKLTDAEAQALGLS